MERRLISDPSGGMTDLFGRRSAHNVWNAVSNGSAENSATTASRFDNEAIINDRTPVLSTFRHQPYGSEAMAVHIGLETCTSGRLTAGTVGSGIMPSSRSELPVTGGRIANDLLTSASEINSANWKTSRNNDDAFFGLPELVATVSYCNDSETPLNSKDEILIWKNAEAAKASIDPGSSWDSPTGNRQSTVSSSVVKPRMVVKPNLESSSSSLSSSPAVGITMNGVDEPHLLSAVKIRSFHPQQHCRSATGAAASGRLHVDDVDSYGSAARLSIHPMTMTLNRDTERRSTSGSTTKQASETGRVTSSGTFPWSSMRLRGGRRRAAADKAQQLQQQHNNPAALCYRGSVDLISSNSTADKATFDSDVRGGDLIDDSAVVELIRTRYSPCSPIARTLPRAANDCGGENRLWAAAAAAAAVDQNSIAGASTAAKRVVDPTLVGGRLRTFCSCDLGADGCRSDVMIAAELQRSSGGPAPIGDVPRNANEACRRSGKYRKDPISRRSCWSLPDCCCGATKGETRLCRLVVSSLVAVLAGLIIFCATRFQLRYGLPTSCGLSAAATSAVGLIVGVSRRLRCLVALAVPSSAATSGGRVGLLLVGIACLIAGPVVDMTANVREMARAMTCSADVAYNHTVLLLQVRVKFNFKGHIG
jgi:hypothetical protein